MAYYIKAGVYVKITVMVLKGGEMIASLKNLQ